MSRKRVHLVCNAHLDPVWLWHWEDGLAEALSTFRVAADFCEQHRGFVFNHNEALLYRWVEEYEPQLFRRIQRLVRQGQWFIAGGAYLQPDVNNASGESHIRHYLLGRRYFASRFGKLPKTGYNFDPFGHGEGFPQILRGCGIEHYLFCRPDLGTYDLPVGAFRWRDRSGSEVIARRGDDHYLTNGRIAEKLDRFLVHFAAEPDILILWGIGNHGGGPSQEEYRRLQQYIKAHPEYEWIESTTDGYFAQRLRAGGELPLVRGEIQNSFPGCYTSMSRVKRGHREAESLMAAAERLSALSWWWGAAPYPTKDLEVAWRDILFSEFHDILPGSAVPSAERDSLQLLAHAREILRRQQFRALHSLICREPDAAVGEAPVFVANPHGFPVHTQVEFEVQLNANAWAIREPQVFLRHEGRDYPCQRLLAEANCAGNWRVRLAAEVKLRPWEIARFDEYYLNDRPAKVRIPTVSARNLSFRNGNFSLRINPRTGLIDHLSLPGAAKSLVRPGALAPAYWADLDHSWTCGSPKRLKGHQVWSTSPGWDAKPAERFRLATRKEAAQLAPTAPDKWLGRKETSARPLRIVEHGPVRTVVEAIFVCGPSALVRQYVIGHPEGSLEIRDRLFNNHRDSMLKLVTPLAFAAERSSSETLYSAAERRPSAEHEERTNQRWVAVRGKMGGKPVYLAALNTGSFAHSLTPGELALNVVRSPAYSSFNIDPHDERLNNRFAPRQDQGEHELRYALLVGGRFDEARVSRAAQVLNTPPVWQVYFPQPEQVERRRRLAVADTVAVDDAQVQVVALKKAEAGAELVVRLYNPSGQERTVAVQVKPFRGTARVVLGAYGLAAIAVRRGGKVLRWRRVNLVEEGRRGSRT